MGKFLGSIAYYLGGKHSKRTLNNLAIAKSLQLSPSQMKAIAKKSFQNLVITTLEYFKLKYSRDRLEEIVVCDNPEIIDSILEQKKGIIFLSGHQANWEVPFLKLTQKISGIAIGRPIKNYILYKWILSIRQMFGGKVIHPKQALTQGLKILQEGGFIGIVGDQALPESSYTYPFFGTKAWTSPAPGLLAYKTGCPIVVTTTYRNSHDSRYHVYYHQPIWPNKKNSAKLEVIRLMDQALGYLEASIRQRPEQWLWQHNRWKQHHMSMVKAKYKYDFILIILPPKAMEATEIYRALYCLKDLYPRGQFTLAVSRAFFAGLDVLEDKWTDAVEVEKIIVYRDDTLSDILQEDWHIQLVFDFYNDPKIAKHFKKLGAFEVINGYQLGSMIDQKSRPVDITQQPLSRLLRLALCS
jgi:KDO2-lipid IV(A) lauroyltransferase